jgi:hypothetical protein
MYGDDSPLRSYDFPDDKNPGYFHEVYDIIDNVISGLMTGFDAGRLILQKFGTEVVRKNFSDTFWRDFVNRKATELRDAVDYVIITDYRFPNEFIPGSKTIKMVLPDNIRSFFSGMTIDKLKELSNHSSESSVDRLPVDLIINNTGTGENFEEEIKSILE